MSFFFFNFIDTLQKCLRICKGRKKILFSFTWQNNQDGISVWWTVLQLWRCLWNFRMVDGMAVAALHMEFFYEMSLEANFVTQSMVQQPVELYVKLLDKF